MLLSTKYEGSVSRSGGEKRKRNERDEMKVAWPHGFCSSFNKKPDPGA